MSDAASRLPNLYQLLGLAPLESDQGKIAAAIKRLQKPEGNEAAASAEELQRVQKMTALAQKYLLDPQRKAAYDQQWKTVYQATPTAPPRAPAPEKAAPVKAAPAKVAASGAPSKATASAAAAATTAAIATLPSPAWDYSRLDQLLPQGDPQAAFDMASFLRTGGESRDPLAAQADLNKLIALLSDAVGGPGDSSAVATALAQPIGVGLSNDEEGHSLGISPSGLSGQAVPTSGSLARRMRQRKQRALLVGGGAIAAGLGGLVLLGIFLFSSKSGPSQTQLAQVAQNKPARTRGSGLPKIDLAAAPSAPDAQAKPPVGSGLPKPGEGAMNLEVETATPEAQPAASMPASKPEPKPEPAPVPQPEPKPDTPAKPAGEPKPEPKPEPEPSPAPAPAADPELTSAEKRAWQKGMTKAKQLIGEHNFQEAEKQLSELKPAAKTSQQRGQLERLEQVLGFVKDIRQAMVEAIAGLGPADTFKVGKSTTASFVEGNDERITVRVAGERRAYRLEEAPVPLGLGLVDLKMDIEHPTSLARKGAYIVMHPNSRMMLEQGKAMLQAAADAGAITPELAKFYEDDYSLSSSEN